MAGKIFERNNAIATQEFTLDYTKDNTYYLSTVAYGEWDTQEFNTENELNEYLIEYWNFTDNELNGLKQNMYVYGE